MSLKLTVCCQKVGLSDGRLYSGRTINVSPGGLLLEMRNSAFRDGELLSIEMTVPPNEGSLEFGGSFSSYARVVRTGRKPAPTDPDDAVALEFCDSPKFQV